AGQVVFPSRTGGLPKVLRGGNARLTPPRSGTEPRPAHTAPRRGGAGGGFGSNRGWVVNGYEDWVFAPETAQFTLRDHFKVATLDGFGLKDRAAAVGAAGAVLHYLTQHLRRDAAHLTQISFYQSADYLVLDGVT